MEEDASTSSTTSHFATVSQSFSIPWHQVFLWNTSSCFIKCIDVWSSVV